MVKDAAFGLEGSRFGVCKVVFCYFRINYDNIPPNPILTVKALHEAFAGSRCGVLALAGPGPGKWTQRVLLELELPQY